MTRETFEKSCGDLKGRFTSPIYDALDNAGLTTVSGTSLALLTLTRGLLGGRIICYFDRWELTNADDPGRRKSSRRGVSTNSLYRLAN